MDYDQLKFDFSDEPSLALITLHGQTFPWVYGSKIMEQDFAPFPGAANLDVHHIQGWNPLELQIIAANYDFIIVFGYSEGGSRSPSLLPRNTIGLILYEAPIRKGIHLPFDLPPSLMHIMTIWNGRGKSARRNPLIESTEEIWQNEKRPFYFHRRLENKLKHATWKPPSHLIDPTFLEEHLVGFISMLQHRAEFPESTKLPTVARRYASEFDLNLTTSLNEFCHKAKGF